MEINEVLNLYKIIVMNRRCYNPQLKKLPQYKSDIKGCRKPPQITCGEPIYGGLENPCKLICGV